MALPKERLKQIPRILKREMSHERENVPYWFVGLCGSLARNKARYYSDCDLLIVVDSGENEANYWRRLPDTAKAIARIASVLKVEMNCPVVVASSIAVQDIMPFVALRSSRTEYLTLHTLVYPNPIQFLRWEPAAIRNSLLAPAMSSDSCLLLGDREAAASAFTNDGAILQGSTAGVDAQPSDACVQAFITGCIQASCHDLYEAEFVSRYTFHLLRYACRYLLPMERRCFAEKKIASVVKGVFPPLVGSQPAESFVLLRQWLMAWDEWHAEPTAFQLPTLFRTASDYLYDLFSLPVT